MEMTLKEIAQLVRGEVVGDERIIIRGLAGIKEAREGDLTFLANGKYASFLKETQASAVIVSRGTHEVQKPLILSEDPYFAFSQLLNCFSSSQSEQQLPRPKGIHPTAFMGSEVEVGDEVYIGPYVVVEDGTKIGSGVDLHAHVYVGRHCTLGDNCIIYPNVTILDRIQIGSGVIIHSGTVIGSDGFGFAKQGNTHHKISHMGSVLIEDDVEIGANCAIDRATMGLTHIKRGTKIDNLVQIGHNVVIGEDSIIVAQVGISGSTRIGERVTLAGQVGVVGHIEIGDDCIVAAKSGVRKSIPSGQKVFGIPAQPHQITKRILSATLKLPDLFKAFRELKKRVEALEARENSFTL